jgi:hypothetical protein
VKYFERALSQDPRVVGLLLDIGARYVVMRRFEEATAGKRALDLAPHFPEAYRLLTAVAYRQGKPASREVRGRRSRHITVDHPGPSSKSSCSTRKGRRGGPRNSSRGRCASSERPAVAESIPLPPDLLPH